MAFESLPLTVREVRASEDVLKRIYDAARKGLRGDTLARAAGLAPIEYRRLVELDPLTEEAAGWGYADAEFAAATAIQTAIDAGDAKIALDFLKHRSDWVAKQAISIETHTNISIIDALGAARERMVTIEGTVNATDQILPPGRTGAYGGLVESQDSGQPREFRHVQLPVAPKGDATGKLQRPPQVAAQNPAGNVPTHRRKRTAPSV